jgi:hypothetical protein
MSLGTDVIQTIGSLVTAAGVVIAARQLFHSQQQARSSFEDQLSAQYREIARQLPIEALLGEELEQGAQLAALPEFYHYFDLSNEQAYLHRHGRVRPDAWREWLEGIQQNLARPAFREAWREVNRRSPESFSDLKTELRQLDTATKP